MPDVQVVFAANEYFFLLAKGLALSIQSTGSLQPGFELAFIDLGCTPNQLRWFDEQGIRVIPFDTELVGLLAQSATGYLRALILRPFLPAIFPNAKAFIWLDSDLWIQSPQVLHLFGSLALAHPEKLFICPEWHYSYVELNLRFVSRQIENLAPYYNTLYDEPTARMMAGRPLLNAGVFSLSRANPLWELWKTELFRLYGRDYGSQDRVMRHMAEQTALNVLVARHDLAIPVDPLFNYLCMYSMPFRDKAGTVRVPLPPNLPVAAVHLCQWRPRRQSYLDRGLLYDSGKYLTDEDKVAIMLPIP